VFKENVLKECRSGGRERWGGFFRDEEVESC